MWGKMMKIKGYEQYQEDKKQTFGSQTSHQ